MNKVILMGRLTRDPEMKQTPSGTAIAKFALAVDRRFSGKDGQKTTDFFDCTAWRQTADVVSKYFRKGSLILLCGHIQINLWNDKDGNKRQSTEIVADEVYFTGEKKTSNKYTADMPDESVLEQLAGFEPAMDDDLPFA